MKRTRLIWILSIITFSLCTVVFYQEEFGSRFIDKEKMLLDDENSPKSQSLTYIISNYIVSLEIEGLDINAQINITYDVSSGYKYNGFKRFICPEIFPLITLAYISESSINVHDDENNNLIYEYREFKGDDGNNYKEIKFYHAGFTGIKTFSMNFIMKNWIIEHFGFSEIHLFNFGTFSIPVERAEYILIFPENHVVSSVFSGAGGVEKTENIGNNYVYTLIQTSDITNDISIKTQPNITNTPPWNDIYWIFMFVLSIVFFLIFIAAGFKIYMFYANMPEEEKQRRKELKEKRRAQTAAYSGCGGCGGGGCGGCGGGCGGCGG